MWLNIGLAEKLTKIRFQYIFLSLFNRDLCSAISFKRSRRELSIDEAEHGSSLKTYQNTFLVRTLVIFQD